MKAFRNADMLTSSLLLKLMGFILVGFSFFYLSKEWSESHLFDELLVFSGQADLPHVGPSPNLNKNFDISSLITSNDSQTVSVASPPPASDRPPLPALNSRLGIVDENGTIREEFVIDGYDSERANDTLEDENDSSSPASVGSNSGGGFKVKKFPACPKSMREYIPCLDNVEAIQKLKSTDKREKFERHCPEQGKGLDCLVPAPEDYKQPIPWPRSKNEVDSFPYLF